MASPRIVLTLGNSAQPGAVKEARRYLVFRLGWVIIANANGSAAMTEQGPPWPKQGPPSYFPSIEKKYGRSIAEWQQVIADCGLDKHMAIVGYLKSEHGMGHGHANALVGWTLAGNVAAR
jgi:hypothetical protein